MFRKQSGTAHASAELARIRDELAGALSRDDALGLSRLRASMLDDMLRAHFVAACEGLGIDASRAPLVLAAAGSYGRGAMGLESDIDVRLLASSTTKVLAARALADAVLYPLWDAGLSVGHQLATPGELLALVKDDLATATSLLDLRVIAGAEKPVRDLVAKFVARLRAHPARFLEMLTEDTHKRHERYGDSVYLLEPELKLGAGGLRDLQVARWMLASIADVDERDALWVLVDHGVVDPHDIDAAARAEAFAWRARNRLHAMAKRRSDRLTFDAQEALARALGYLEGEGDDQARDRATERFMQDYYVHARAISRVLSRATSLTLRNTHPRAIRRRDLGNGLGLASGAVAIDDHAAITRDPAIALRAYDACVRLGAPIDEASRDAIARAMVNAQGEVCAALRASPDAAALFVALLCITSEVPALGVTLARELHDVGILLAMIPEFLPVMGRVHHDVYHVLTVDVHSVAAIDCLRDLARGDLAAAHPLASRLAAEIASPRPLFLATLLHDIGKGHGGSAARKNHSVTGAELCDVVLPRLGFTDEETADARALVLHHLTMYHLATRRDLDDAATVEELCRIVRGRAGLRDLYLLTIADITTTSPAAMTSWKAHMLEELFLRADARLAESGGAASLSGDAFEAERITAITAEIACLDPDALTFASSMPVRYLLAMPPASIATHARIARSRGAGSCAVGLGPPHTSRGESEVCIVARDRHGLLARIAAALASSRLEVSAAHISTRETEGGREAVDVFFVRDPREPAAVASKMAGVERDLALLCDDRTSASALVAERLGTRAPWSVRKTPDVRTRVAFDERTSPHATIIEVFAKDEPGLLFRLARAIEESSLSITLSKINTEGTKVADVFYVQELDGRKVSGKARLEAIRERLIDATH